jgi:hypothetical protein
MDVLRMPKPIAVAAIAMLAAATAQGQDKGCTAASGPHTAALVELYTSEGCSSCPPADRWFNALRAGGPALDRLVPLALHVDYWDYIGWKDPWASPRFSARQRELAAVARSRVVYTPQVVLAGRDYRGWHSRERFLKAVADVNAKPSRARIELALRPAAAGTASLRAAATVPAPADREGAALYVALYEHGLSSRVTAGENRGATLAHDHVVREWWGPLALGRDGSASFERALDGHRLARGGIAAFVQDRTSGGVLQALALPACGGAVASAPRHGG